jgi:hypothetical protein
MNQRIDLVGMAALITAILLPLGAGSTQAATRITPPCSVASLRIKEPQEPIVAAGDVAELFQIENFGYRSCSLTGFPRIAFRRSSGIDFTIPVTHLLRSRGVGGGMRRSGSG